MRRALAGLLLVATAGCHIVTKDSYWDDAKNQKLGADPDFKLVPPPYSYWLGKRAKSAFEGKPSTWMTSLGSQEATKGSS